MSQFDHVFGNGDYFECTNCGSLATLDKDGRLMRMILNAEGLPVIYEEQNKDLFIRTDGSFKCNCAD